MHQACSHLVGRAEFILLSRFLVRPLKIQISLVMILSDLGLVTWISIVHWAFNIWIRKLINSVIVSNMPSWVDLLDHWRLTVGATIFVMLAFSLWCSDSQALYKISRIGVCRRYTMPAWSNTYRYIPDRLKLATIIQIVLLLSELWQLKVIALERFVKWMSSSQFGHNTCFSRRIVIHHVR